MLKVVMDVAPSSPASRRCSIILLVAAVALVTAVFLVRYRRRGRHVSLLTELLVPDPARRPPADRLRRAILDPQVYPTQGQGFAAYIVGGFFGLGILILAMVLLGLKPKRANPGWRDQTSDHSLTIVGRSTSPTSRERVLIPTALITDQPSRLPALSGPDADERRRRSAAPRPARPPARAASSSPVRPREGDRPEHRIGDQIDAERERQRRQGTVSGRCGLGRGRHQPRAAKART